MNDHGHAPRCRTSTQDHGNGSKIHPYDMLHPAVLTSGLGELKHFFQFTLLKERRETYGVFHISASFFAKSL